MAAIVIINNDDPDFWESVGQYEDCDSVPDPVVYGPDDVQPFPKSDGDQECGTTTVIDPNGDSQEGTIMELAS